MEDGDQNKKLAFHAFAEVQSQHFTDGREQAVKAGKDSQLRQGPILVADFPGIRHCVRPLALERTWAAYPLSANGLYEALLLPVIRMQCQSQFWAVIPGSSPAVRAWIALPGHLLELGTMWT